MQYVVSKILSCLFEKPLIKPLKALYSISKTVAKWPVNCLGSTPLPVRILYERLETSGVNNY